jgi:hypothetical protein
MTAPCDWTRLTSVDCKSRLARIWPQLSAEDERRPDIEPEVKHMSTIARLALAVAVLLAAVSGVALHAASGAPAAAKPFAATFSESAVSITNRIADTGVFQLINTGTGTVDGYGAATLVIGVTQDRAVEPCGPGSWTNAAVRRIAVDAGVLVLRATAYVCQTASGPVATERWTVDGPSSTGVFAGARGSGVGTVNLTTRTSTLSGKLKLAHQNG